MEECNRALEPFIKSGGVSNIIQDTYVRELERYGDKNIISSETLFYYDSALIYRIYKYGKNLGTSDLFLLATISQKIIFIFQNLMRRSC